RFPRCRSWDRRGGSARSWSRNANVEGRSEWKEEPADQELIIALAARLILPAVYPFRYFCTNGGLACYRLDPVEQQRGAASYIDRILRGEKPFAAWPHAPDKLGIGFHGRRLRSLWSSSA